MTCTVSFCHVVRQTGSLVTVSQCTCRIVIKHLLGNCCVNVQLLKLMNVSTNRCSVTVHHSW